MSSEKANTDSVVQSLKQIEDGLSQLVDLFRRRLSDDRFKAKAIHELQERLAIAETGIDLHILRPLVLRIALIIDRCDTYAGDGREFVSSVIDELLDALETSGVTTVPTDGAVDPRLHEVRASSGSRDSELLITSVLRRGYISQDRLLRPALVDAHHRE